MSTNQQTRMQAGKDSEKELKRMLEGWGFYVTMTGQERFLSSMGLSLLQQMPLNDYMVRAIRHKPDLLAVHKRNQFPAAYWDAKHKLTYNTDYFILGRAFYYEQLARMGKQERVVIAFKDPAGSWFAHWANALKPHGDVPAPVSRYGGRLEDKVRFRVNGFLPIKTFIGRYKMR